MSILLAAGTLGSPGIVIISQSRQLGILPLDTLISLTVILNPFGLANSVGSSDNEY